MIGKRSPQASLYDVGNVWPLKLASSSFFGQLAEAGDRLFKDQDFAEFYCQDNGRPSVPPSELALLLVMQTHDGVSDAEAIARTAYDLRYSAVLRRHAGEPLCAKSTLQLFRAHLVLYEKARSIFKQSVQEAKRVGLLKGEALKVALDTKPIEGRGAVEDTYNLLATGIGLLAEALAKLRRKSKSQWLKDHNLDHYSESSIKGGADIDWANKDARERFLTKIVADARRILALAAGGGPEIKEAADLLEKLLLQDVEETTDQTGAPRSTIKEGTSASRIPSATDPEVRHGRKSKSKRFNGHKVSVAAEVTTGIIVAVDVLPGDCADSTGALDMTKQAEENTGLSVEETIGDCAYGSGATRQEFADAGRTLLAKVPQENANGGFFPKSAFSINLRGRTATCPGGYTTRDATDHKDGGRTFYFDEFCGDCKLRHLCTASLYGRSLAVHPQERLLRGARRYQKTRKGRVHLRKRVIVENSLARLAHLGIGQARYRGRAMTLFQLAMSSTVANLRRTWNWAQGQAAVAGSSAITGGIMELRTA